MAYTNYNFGHDEVDHASDIFKRWKWARYPDVYYDVWSKIPRPFGPFHSPKQQQQQQQQQQRRRRRSIVPVATSPSPGSSGSTTTATILFKTSRTYLETLFPTQQFRFSLPNTVAAASFEAVRVGDRTQLALYVHGIEYSDAKATQVLAEGRYLAVLFESGSANEIEGWSNGPRVVCDVSLEHVENSGSCRVVLAHEGTGFFEMVLFALQEVSAEVGPGRADATFTYRYLPAKDGHAEAGGGEYSFAMVPSTEDTVGEPEGRKLRTRWTTKSSEVKVDAGDWERLPTLHHVAAVLAEIPVYEVIGGEVVEMG